VDDLVGSEMPKGSWDTIGGLLLDEVGGVPEEGESAEVDGFRLTVLVMDGRRVERVRVERIDPSLGNGRNAQGDP